MVEYMSKGTHPATLAWFIEANVRRNTLLDVQRRAIPASLRRWLAKEIAACDKLLAAIDKHIEAAA